MLVTIYGPNLADQSRGTFRVHADGCGHEAPLEIGGMPSPAWTITCASRAEATLEVYSDQIREGAGYESCRGDLFFEVCCHALPEGDAEAVLAEWLEDETKGAEDHALSEAELAQEHMGIDGAEAEADEPVQHTIRLTPEAREQMLAAAEAGRLAAATDELVELAERMGQFHALMATGMEAAFNGYTDAVGRVRRQVREASDQIHDVAGPDGTMGTGIRLGDMPTGLALEDASPRPMLNALQAAGEYTLYHHAHQTIMSFAVQLDQAGQALGMGHECREAFREAQASMRRRLADEGIAGGGDDA